MKARIGLWRWGIRAMFVVALVADTLAMLTMMRGNALHRSKGSVGSLRDADSVREEPGLVTPWLAFVAA